MRNGRRSSGVGEEIQEIDWMIVTRTSAARKEWREFDIGVRRLEALRDAIVSQFAPVAGSA
jgi:hypothetical protein